MTKIPRLGHTIDRFNQGCAFFNQAVSAWFNGNLSEYETSLRKAATEAIGALEWALKIYLRSVCRSKIAAEDIPQLKHPNFDTMMTLMQKYADPSLNSETIGLLYDYRDLFRNAAEHDASIPPSQELYNAIQKVRDVFLTYLPVEDNQLKRVSSISKDSTIDDLRDSYLETIRSLYEYMDLGGISPRVGSKVVKIRMEDLFIPLEATEGEPLLESFPEYLRDEVPEVSEDPTSLADDLSVESGEVATLDLLEVGTQDITLSRHQALRPRQIEPSQILLKPRVVILGHPGSGKTTVGKHIAYSIASGKTKSIGEHLNHYIPVFVKAGEFALSLQKDSGLSFYEYITQKHSPQFRYLFEWALKNGRCLAIIDGLDEIPEARLRITTSRRIERFVSEFQENRFLVESRIVGYRQNQLAGDFAHLSLSELDDNQILDFLEKWHRAIECEAGLQVSDIDIKRRSSELWSAIKSSPGIRKLAGNPLLLTIIALANWRGTKLPSRRVELYQIATETLIENWPLKQRGVTLDSEEILAILEPIAREIFDSGRNNMITEFDLRPLFEAQVREVRGATAPEARAISRDMLQTIELDTGFFLQKGFDQRGRKIYGFLHQTFAEYLTARSIAEEWSSGEIGLAKYVHDPRWHEVMLLMAGHVGTWATAQATRLVNDLLQLDSGYEHHLHRNLLLAAEILSDNVRIKRELQDRIVSDLICLALNTPHIPLLSATANSLRGISKVFQLGTPTAQIQFQDKDPFELRVRKALLQAVSGVQSDEVVKTLFLGLTNSKTYLLVDSLLYSLDILTRTDDPTHLFAIETDNTISFFPLPEHTARRIIRLNIPFHGVQDLLDWQETIDKGDCRLWLLDPQKLIEIGTSALVSLITTETRSFQGIIAAETLSFRQLPLPLFDELFEQATSSGSTQVRLETLEALGTLFSMLYYPRLHSEPERILAWADMIRPVMLSDDPNIRLKSLKLLSILLRNSRDWIKVQSQALNDRDEMVRSAGASMTAPHRYGRRVPSEIRDRLQVLLTDTSPRVRQASARALVRAGRFDEQNIITLLAEGYRQPIESTKDDEPFTWMSDLLLLAQEAHSSETINAIGTYFKMLIESKAGGDVNEYMFLDPFIGRQISRPPLELVEFISPLFDNPDPSIRRLAVSAWSYIRSESTQATQILELLRDNVPEVRLVAIRALRPTDLRELDITEILVHSFAEENAEIAENAAWVLSRVQDSELRQMVINRVGNFLDQNPQNQHAFGILWQLMGTSEMWGDEIPF